MRHLAKSCLIAILIAAIINIPAFAADEKPLGLVTQALSAHLGDATVAIGTTVYPGDTIATEVGGTARLKIGGGQIYLLSSSAATLSQSSNAVHAVVARGTVGFSSTGTDQLALEIPEGILHAADGMPSYGQVTIISPLEVVITAYRGTLVLDNDGELHTISEGKSYRVTMDYEPAAARTTRSRGSTHKHQDHLPETPPPGLRPNHDGSRDWRRLRALVPPDRKPV